MKTLNGILSTLTIIPIIFIVISMCIMIFYKVDAKMFEKIKTELANRQQNN
jgi:Na+/melibiose symporter-like transporter